MKVYFIVIIILINFSCRQSLQDAMLKKIELFERNETKYFENTTVEALRNSPKQKPLEFKMRRKDVLGYAIFQATPDHIIFKNFYYDSIQLDVVRVIDSLKIRGLYNFNEKTQLEFYNQDEYVVLYRESPYNKTVTIETSKPQEVIRNWKYFTFKLVTN